MFLRRYYFCFVWTQLMRLIDRGGLCNQGTVEKLRWFVKQQKNGNSSSPIICYQDSTSENMLLQYFRKIQPCQSPGSGMNTTTTTTTTEQQRPSDGQAGTTKMTMTSNVPYRIQIHVGWSKDNRNSFILYSTCFLQSIQILIIISRSIYFSFHAHFAIAK